MKFLNFSKKITCLALIVLFFVGVGWSAAQTEIEIEDDSTIVQTGDEENQNMDTQVDQNVGTDVMMSETQTEVTQQPPRTFTESPTVAPSSGPAESVIIIAAITMGFLGAVIFLALVVHDRY